MSYIGNQPTIGQYRKLDDISGSFNGSLTAFTMQVGSTNVSAGSVFQLLISLGGVIQEPGTDFTVSGSTITFTTAPAASLSFFGIMMGQPLNTATPGDSTVTGAKIVDGTITGAKLAAAFNYDSGLLFLDDTNNRVGIGETSPQANLHVTGANTAARGQFVLEGASADARMTFYRDADFIGHIAGNSDHLDIATETGHHIEFSPAGSERARITSAGRVGINTISPDYTVDINGELGITEGQPVTWHDGSGSASGQIFCTSGDDMVFRTTSTGLERMRIISSGALRIIANASNESRLEFNGTSTRIQEHTASGHISFYTNSAVRNQFLYNGQGTTFENQTRIYPVTDNAVLNGQSGQRWSAVWAANGTIQTSDSRQKCEIQESALGTDFIKSLRPVSYKWIEGGKSPVVQGIDENGENIYETDEDGNWVYGSNAGVRTHWGFIAQEVKQAVDNAGVDFGGWVLTDKDDPDSEQALRYDQFVAPLTKALQEAIAKIEILETANASLEARLTALEGGTP